MKMAEDTRKFTLFMIAYWHDPRFKRKVGGLIRIFELANNFTELGNSVVLYMPKIGSPRKQTIAKVIEIPFIDIPLIRPLSFQLISTLILFSRMIGHVDFLYVRKMNSFLPMLMAKLFRIPIIFEIPNDPYLGYQAIGKIKRLLEKIIDKYSMMLADKIVVLSHWSKLRLNKIGRIPLSKIAVLPSGTDTKLFRPLKKEESCRELGLEPSFIYVGFVGTFFIYQGIDTLIKAAPFILEKFTNTRFLLVGDGPMMETWKNMVNEKRLQNAFIFIGQIPYKKVPNYIGAMDICVAPHQKKSNQASPVKIFDYMACGRPVVASNIEAAREIMGKNKGALLIAPERPNHLAKGIISLIEDERRRKEMGREGRKHAIHNFDRRKIAEDLMNIFLNFRKTKKHVFI